MDICLIQLYIIFFYFLYLIMSLNIQNVYHASDTQQPNVQSSFESKEMFWNKMTEFPINQLEKIKLILSNIIVVIYDAMQCIGYYKKNLLDIERLTSVISNFEIKQSKISRNDWCCKFDNWCRFALLRVNHLEYSNIESSIHSNLWKLKISRA